MTPNRAMSFRPNTAAVSDNRINVRLLNIAAFGALVITLLLGASQRAHAQRAFASTASRSVAGHIEGRLGQILSIHSVGTPVALTDGRVEQRYQVSANVAFAFSAAEQPSDSVRVAVNGTEMSLGDYTGTPGFHTEIVVRSAAPMPAALQIKPALRGTRSE